MKKAIISLALAFLGIANLYAVKAKPGIAKIMLADGTVACATRRNLPLLHAAGRYAPAGNPRRKIRKDNC